jgi:hypothetical protein
MRSAAPSAQKITFLRLLLTQVSSGSTFQAAACAGSDLSNCGLAWLNSAVVSCSWCSCIVVLQQVADCHSLSYSRWRLHQCSGQHIGLSAASTPAHNLLSSFPLLCNKLLPPSPPHTHTHRTLFTLQGMLMVEVLWAGTGTTAAPPVAHSNPALSLPPSPVPPSHCACVLFAGPLPGRCRW